MNPDSEPLNSQSATELGDPGRPQPAQPEEYATATLQEACSLGKAALSGSDAGETAVPAIAEPAMIAILEQGMARLETSLEGLQQQQAQTLNQLRNVLSRTVDIAETQRIAAEQLRRFGTKVDQVSSGVASSQFRHLAEGLVLFHDLVAGMADNKAADSCGSVPATCQMLGRQLIQLFQSVGIETFGAEGTPDYQIHRAVQTVAAESPEQVGQIVGVQRSGFRSGAQLIRPADVVIAVRDVSKSETVDSPAAGTTVNTTSERHEQNFLQP
jgi:molecular chaperone GrpE (heat shock protein)